MSSLKQNTSKLHDIINMVNDLYDIKTCTITITTASGIILDMYCANTFNGNSIEQSYDSNMIIREENFPTPVTIENVIVGSCVNFSFRGAILDAISINGDASTIELGSGNYAVIPRGNCTILCYDDD